MKAEQWGKAHELLFEKLAPEWFLQQPGQLPKLKQCASQLASHAHEIDEELSYAAFRSRVGLYNGFFTLQVSVLAIYPLASQVMFVPCAGESS